MVKLLISASVVLSVMLGGDSTGPAFGSATAECGECLDMMGGGGPGHSFQTGGEGSYMGSHVNWMAGTCAGTHSSCSGDIPGDSLNLAVIDEIVESGDVLLISAALQQASAKIRFNEARRSLQLFGCDGIIVANIPVEHRSFAD